MVNKGLKKQTENYNTVRHRVERALKLLGYPYFVEELPNEVCRVHLAYQGEDYYIHINESDYIRLQLIDGTYALVNDIEEFSRLRRAINEANWKSAVTIVYTILEEEQEVLLNFKSYALAIREIPNFDQYLQGELSEFFNAQKNVWYELKKARRAEKQLKKNLSLPPDEYDNHYRDNMKQKDEVQELFLETLEEMGCPYDIDEECNIIRLDYKNERLLAKVVNDTNGIIIHCPYHTAVDLNEIDEVMRLKQAVNTANADCFLRTYYENDYDNHELKVSSANEIYFTSYIEDKKNYLRTKFDEFIEVQQTIQLEMDALRKDGQGL